MYRIQVMKFTDNLSCVVYDELLSHKYNGHLRCASVIRSVIKINSSVLTRADGVFIASVVVFLQKFIHNSRNPIFAELQQIFRIRVFLIEDLCQLFSDGLAKKPREKFLTCPALRLAAVDFYVTGFTRSVHK